MFEQRVSKRCERLLPWYVNETLPAAERESVSNWLRRSPRSAADLAGWRRVGEAVRGQETQPAPPEVVQRIIAQIRSPQWHWPRARLAWAWGTVLAGLILVLLWGTIRPGIVLQWAAAEDPLTAFRVYRAAQGSTQFDLLREIPVQPGVERYTYVDARLWPPQTFTYRVEGVGQEGRWPATSQLITASALEAFPGQLAILLTSLVAGYGIGFLLLQQAAWGNRRWVIA